MEPTIAEIRIFAGNFAPRGWALCQGQLLPINQNQALFSILGTNYGGDGRTTFGLPDMRGRTAIHAGDGPGLTDRPLGSKGGQETETLTIAQIPWHNHADNVMANTTTSNLNDPSGAFPAVAKADDNGTSSPVLAYADTKNVTFPSNDTSNFGGGQSFDIRQPYIALNYIIALYGLFPSRS